MAPRWFLVCDTRRHAPFGLLETVARPRSVAADSGPLCAPDSTAKRRESLSTVGFSWHRWSQLGHVQSAHRGLAPVGPEHHPLVMPPSRLLVPPGMARRAARVGGGGGGTRSRCRTWPAGRGCAAWMRAPLVAAGVAELPPGAAQVGQRCAAEAVAADDPRRVREHGVAAARLARLPGLGVAGGAGEECGHDHGALREGLVVRHPPQRHAVVGEPRAVGEGVGGVEVVAGHERRSVRHVGQTQPTRSWVSSRSTGSAQTPQHLGREQDSHPQPGVGAGRLACQMGRVVRLPGATHEWATPSRSRRISEPAGGSHGSDQGAGKPLMTVSASRCGT
jgi:hypothetical protein